MADVSDKKAQIKEVRRSLEIFSKGCTMGDEKNPENCEECLSYIHERLSKILSGVDPDVGE